VLGDISQLDSVHSKVTKLIPEFNKMYFINKYTLFHILKGRGGIEVDFKNHYDSTDKIIFLDKGQYIKFLSENFVVRKIEFEDEAIFQNQDVRVLFKHLVSLGYIDFKECADCQKYLDDTVLSSKTTSIIDISSEQWYWQNPFHANKEEYHVIFDVKEIIDNQYRNHLNNHDISEMIGLSHQNVHALYNDKVGFTVKALMGDKRLLESKKEIAFTEKSIQEIAYDFGYKDPAYFNRTFKSQTDRTPKEFRKSIAFNQQDLFINNLYELIENFQTEQRKIGFYADKMNMSVKTFSKKVRDKLQTSIGQIIRHQLIETAKDYLDKDLPIKEISRKLGFEEANHFSTFFKHYTGSSPSDFRK